MVLWKQQPASRESGACSPRPANSPGGCSRKGFEVVERQDLVIRGVAIHNYRMAKTLDLAASWEGGTGPHRGYDSTF